jgi:hypothetical protein
MRRGRSASPWLHHRHEVGRPVDARNSPQRYPAGAAFVARRPCCWRATPPLSHRTAVRTDWRCMRNAAATAARIGIVARNLAASVFVVVVIAVF